ncbi:molybdate ABC transporter substrate-binding protein [Ramlibacter sp. MAHUQ-53]|uniref:molybdate ABC transporter substrate-binding protein n=1 Tax=unclassified Ramlibacter TaxID=2617605 RepID=UPI00363CDE3E
MTVRLKPWLAAAAAALACASAAAGQVSVAVAANFAGPMQKIASAFERATGHQAVVAVGATGRFYAQVRNGAPFQVLLAADDETPARLEREGLGVAGTRFTYAVGRLALWSPDPARVDPQGEVLRRGGFERLAIADPRLAPYGAAAMEAMERLGVLAALRPKLVQGESIGQAYQFVATGNAALGFVALSQVQAQGRLTAGSAWVVPAGLHAPLRQDAILLVPGRDSPAARALLAFLRTEEARALLRAHGYEP